MAEPMATCCSKTYCGTIPAPINSDMPAPQKSKRANFIERAYDSVGRFLDKNPTLYKIVLVVSHFFRAAAMYGMMLVMPVPIPAAMGIMLGGSLLYRAAVERFCCFRFALPSFVGAVAIWVARAAIINIVSGTVLHPVGMVLGCTLALAPLAGYVTWVSYQSHVDINKRMKKIKKPSGGCCV